MKLVWVHLIWFVRILVDPDLFGLFEVFQGMALVAALELSSINFWLEGICNNFELSLIDSKLCTAH